MEVRRNEKITFRCTRYEKLALAEQAARCSMSTSEYCRSLSLGGRPRERYTEEGAAICFVMVLMVFFGVRGQGAGSTHETVQRALNRRRAA